ncbi:MAG: nucleotidyltransferase domain-containing protein [bacterium]
MNLEHYSVEKLKEEIIKIISKYLDISLYHIFFFGSRVRGNNSTHADIDIGIKGPKTIPAGIKILIEDELEQISTLYKIDFVDFSDVSKKFEKEALKYSEYV